MNDFALKYDKLDIISKREVEDFLDYLLSKKKIHASQKVSSYKQQLLEVGIWSDDDISIMENFQKSMINLEIPKW